MLFGGLERCELPVLPHIVAYEWRELLRTWYGAKQRCMVAASGYAAWMLFGEGGAGAGGNTFTG